MPEVSVIIPNYNHARFLHERIESVLGQSYQDIELILLDDCSTDESRTVMETYRSHPKVSAIHYNIHNSGSPFKQWQKGFGLTKGSYIWIAESDDRAEPDFLETMMAILKKGHGLAYCRSASMDAHGNMQDVPFWADGLDNTRWKTDHENNGADEIGNYLVYRCTIPNASACVFEKKHIPDNSGYTTMRYCGDWLFWVALLRTTSVGFSARTLNHFRHHAASTRNRKSPQEEERKIREIIHVIEHARKIGGLKAYAEDEYPLYDWVLPNFHRQLVIPERLKERTIFYLNRHSPGVYQRYLDLRHGWKSK